MMYAILIPHVVAMLAHLVGLVIAIFLLVRTKSKAAILAAVGFGLFALINLGQIMQPLLPFGRAGQWLPWVLSCCCSMFDLAAIGCLIVAFWQAVSGASAGDKTTPEPSDDVETWEEEIVTDASEYAPDDAIFATEKLDIAEETLPATEAVEEETVTDAPDDAMFATEKLDIAEETLPAAEAVEEGILPDAPPENPYTTKFLSETEKDVSATKGEENDENE